MVWKLSESQVLLMSAEVSTFDVMGPLPHVCLDGKFPHIGISATVVTAINNISTET